MCFSRAIATFTAHPLPVCTFAIVRMPRHSYRLTVRSRSQAMLRSFRQEHNRVAARRQAETIAQEKYGYFIRGPSLGITCVRRSSGLAFRSMPGEESFRKLEPADAASV